MSAQPAEWFRSGACHSCARKKKDKNKKEQPEGIHAEGTFIGADEVYLCTASIADTGTVVPARMRTIPASEFGAVTVSEPGLYALCAGDTSSPSATVLINATDSGDAIANVRV